jgi:hypothetical protein
MAVVIKARCGHEQMNLGKINNVFRDRERENSWNWSINKIFKILQKTEELKS